ncbi:MAG: serine/threonine protein kinase, partial [Deltaproteobacteria bacterium]|nr:serine/threonine protein kinase [Deltaproteobacteria bacterium]
MRTRCEQAIDRELDPALVKGSTLRGWFREPHGWRTVVSTLRQAGSGLVAAHEAKLVHGDFKPDNVLVAEDGRILVTDFGLVRSSAEDPVETASIELAGTPAYMAPEQLEAHAATTASDQFNFCVSLFEALYGRRPFEGSNLDELRASLAIGRIDVPSRRGVPARIVRALRRGLSARPADRFPSMKALLAELDASRSRTLWIAAGAVLATAAVATTAVLATRGPEPCSDGEAQLAGVWDANTRDSVNRAFAASKLPYAATSLATVTSMLDGARARWLATYSETCKATHVRKEQSEALLDIRMICMRQRREEVRAVVQELTGGTVRDSVPAVAALRPISDCEDLESLQEIKGLPADHAARELIAAIDVELARCRA